MSIASEPVLDVELVAELVRDASPILAAFDIIFAKYGSETADGIIAGLVYYKAQLDAKSVLIN